MTNELSTRLLDGAIQSIYEAGRAAGRDDVLCRLPLDREPLLKMLDELQATLAFLLPHMRPDEVRTRS